MVSAALDEIKLKQEVKNLSIFFSGQIFLNQVEEPFEC